MKLTKIIYYFSILKLHESGIINALKSRWLRINHVSPNTKIYYSPITISQVYLIIGTYICGLCVSVVIILIEQILYLRTVKKKKWNK